MHAMVLSSGTPSRVVIGEASPFYGAAWTSITLTNNERGYTTKVDFSWSALHYVLVRCPLPPTRSVCVWVGGGGWGWGWDYFALPTIFVGSGKPT